MSDDIVVYNLQDDGTPVEAVASQPASTTGVVASATASTAAPSGSPASTITEGDVRNFIHQELAHYSGDIRVGALLSGQVFILDADGLRMGGTKFSDAPFSVTYDGHLIATSATITIATLGGFDIGADYIRDTANTFGLASTVTGSDDVRFFAGATFASRTNAPARIYESGAAYFTDATIAGTIRTSVFEKDVVSAVGGQLIVANADVLDTAMTALDSATLTIKGETTFAVNDMLHLKDGTDEEYMRVTAIGSAPTYSVTRDLASAYTSNSNPAWAAGTAVVVEGSSDGASTFSGGFLKLLGSGTNSPKYSVFKRTGAAYGGITEYCTLGNLNGVLDYSAEEYGIAVGTSTDGYMSFDPTKGFRVVAKKASFPGIPMIGMLVVNASSIPDTSSPKNLVMTNNGRYLLAGDSTAATFNVFDSFSEYDYNYPGFYDYQRTALAANTGGSTRVVSGSTDYIIAANTAGGGTTLRRYDADGQNETSVTISGTTFTAIARLGYHANTGYVYIQDGALTSTTIKRFTFSGSTLTYVDTITLNSAPANEGPSFIWIGDTNLCFIDAYPSGSSHCRVTWQRYNKTTGVQASSRDFGSLNTLHVCVGFSVRPPDNACIEWHTSATNGLLNGYTVSNRLDT